MILPPEALPLLEALAPAFTRPTFRRFVTLPRRRHPDHRPAHRRQPPPHRRPAGRRPPHHLPARLLLGLVVGDAAGLRPLPARPRPASPPTGPSSWSATTPSTATPAGKVYGKARHRDPVRSSHGYTAWRYGHKWVVLAVLVRFPFATRPWALPVLVDLYRSEEDDRRRGRPHRTPAQLMCQLLRRHAAAVPRPPVRLRRRRRLRHPRGRPVLPPPPRPADAGQQAPPRRQPVRAAAAVPGNGRPRVKGPRRAQAAPGGGRRRAADRGRSPGTAAARGGWASPSGTGHWYKAGDGLVPIRWVFVRDPTAPTATSTSSAPTRPGSEHHEGTLM